VNPALYLWLDDSPAMFSVWEEVGVLPTRWGELPVSSLQIPAAALPLELCPLEVREITHMLSSDAATERSPATHLWGDHTTADPDELTVAAAVGAGALVAGAPPFFGAPAGAGVTEILAAIDAQLVDLDDRELPPLRLVR